MNFWSNLETNLTTLFALSATDQQMRISAVLKRIAIQEIGNEQNIWKYLKLTVPGKINKLFALSSTQWVI